MATREPSASFRSLPSATRNATLAYVLPFLVFVVLLEVEHAIALPAQVFYPVRFLAVSLTLLLVSRRYISLGTSFPVASIGIGVLVFLLWVAPDALFGYRHHWLFQNFVTGAAESTILPEMRRSAVFTTLRVLTSVILVPILEELFWRGWLMRWLIDTNFLKVAPGKYAPMAFWAVAILFASEHGAYWEVGLGAGIIYNWWMVRSRNLADCMLAHAVTNALLAAYVLIGDHWQYWL
ncbi:MAG TPA: CAAX prenyl protease-related protein [Bryobacteraceae bacterium]